MIGIVTAMEKEMDAIVEILDSKEVLNISGIRMVKGSIANKKVIVMLSGVGKGNAAMSTTILLENFVIDKILNIGTAGGLRAEQEVLDIVIANRVVQYDYDTSPIDGKDGIGLYFDAKQELIECCDKVLKKMNVIAHIGLIASGDQFIAEERQLTFLAKQFPDAICAEMEAGAIAQVCAHYHVSFTMLRSLSDIAYREDSHIDFISYVQQAAKRSAVFCKEFVSLM